MERLAGVLNTVLSILNYFGIKVRFSTRISWKRLISAVKKIDPDIKKYNPDVIIGLSDGMVVAGIIATNISFSHFLSYYTLGVEVQHDHDGERIIQLLGKEVIPKLTGKKVLIVDNHIYTGVTLKKALDFLETRDAREVKSLVLFDHEIEEKVCNPNFKAYTIRGKRSRVPWSYSECHKSLYNT